MNWQYYIKNRLVLRKDTKENWDRINPTLLCGELALVFDGDDKYLIIGDGQSKYADLAKIKLDKSINNLILRYHGGDRFTLEAEENES